MRNNYILFLFSLIFSINQSSFAQGENLFNDDVVHEVYLTFEDANFWAQLTSNYDDNYPNIPYIMANAVIDGQAVDSIGVRLKGFSSYWVATNKKSIKLDFNEFVSGKKYDGIKKVNLNNGEGDPAVQRDKLCYNIMRTSGVKAARTSYTKVYLNGTYWGLYIAVEQIDKTFLDHHFGDNDGNLFKNMGNSNLEWLGTDTLAYDEVFDLKTGYQEGAWERFVNLMNVINNTPAASFKEDIAAIFDVDLYLKVLAVDVATNNWDSYLEHGRNFYLYENPVTMKFQWIPWDYNLAIGGQFSTGGGGGGGGSGTDPADCLTIQNGSSPYPATDTIFQQVIAQDPFCCDTDWDGTCQGLYDQIESGNGGGGGGFVSTFPIDMSSSEKTLINRLLAVPEYRELYYQYFCGLLENNFTTDRIFPMIESDGDLIRDFIYDDPNYMWTTAKFEEDLDQGNALIPGLKKFFLERSAALNTELAGLYTCSDLTSSLNLNDIVINEFMASNDSLSTISDADGEHDDWIELYNNTSENISLSNAYLSDNPDEPQKWKFPIGTTINAGDYLIVWADKDEGQEGLHANFKLSKGGDFIMMTEYNQLLDSIRFDEQTTNMTASRIPNGTGNFVIKDATFSANNENTVSTTDSFKKDLKVNIYPNPASAFVNVAFDINPAPGTILTLYNSVGQQVNQQEASNKKTTLALNKLSAGIYMLSIENPKQEVFMSRKISVYKN